jgi:hypothetical protein
VDGSLCSQQRLALLYVESTVEQPGSSHVLPAEGREDASLPRTGGPNCTFLPLVEDMFAPSAGPEATAIREAEGGGGHAGCRLDHATQIPGRTPEISSVPQPG